MIHTHILSFTQLSTLQIHLIHSLDLDQTLALVLLYNDASVHHHSRHHRAVQPECSVKPQLVQKGRVHLRRSKHVKGRAGSYNPKAIRPKQKAVKYCQAQVQVG